MNKITKNIATETVGSVVENGFAALASAAGFPAIALATPLVKGIILGLLENCYNDCSQRTLSIREGKKLNRVSEMALLTFRELAEKDGVKAWELNIDPSYIDYAFEVAEHATMEAIRQSEMAKVDILGRYYGKSFYEGKTDWQDIHQMITMAGALTFRQLVMIRLISEGFKGLDGNLFITNPSACVEINRLKDYGIWQTTGAAFGINESVEIQLERIIATFYADQVNESLMLGKLSDEDIHRTIDSLMLSEKGTPQPELTEDVFIQKTSFDVDGEALVLQKGTKFGGDPDKDMFRYDLVRGK